MFSKAGNQSGTEPPGVSAHSQSGHGFGTAPVFLASVSTILGAILFLRFGYAVAHVGLWGSLMIILLGHLVTIPTVLAVSEIATNRRVAGGGAYYIVSQVLRHEYRGIDWARTLSISGNLGRLLYGRVRGSLQAGV